MSPDLFRTPKTRLLPLHHEPLLSSASDSRILTSLLYADRVYLRYALEHDSVPIAL